MNNEEKLLEMNNEEKMPKLKAPFAVVVDRYL
jgi:hypothetical protein